MRHLVIALLSFFIACDPSIKLDKTPCKGCSKQHFAFDMTTDTMSIDFLLDTSFHEIGYTDYALGVDFYKGFSNKKDSIFFCSYVPHPSEFHHIDTTNFIHRLKHNYPDKILSDVRFQLGDTVDISEYELSTYRQSYIRGYFLNGTLDNYNLQVYCHFKEKSVASDNIYAVLKESLSVKIKPKLHGR